MTDRAEYCGSIIELSGLSVDSQIKQADKAQIEIVRLYLENRKDMDEAERKIILDSIRMLSNPPLVAKDLKVQST